MHQTESLGWHLLLIGPCGLLECSRPWVSWAYYIGIKLCFQFNSLVLHEDDSHDGKKDQDHGNKPGAASSPSSGVSTIAEMFPFDVIRSASTTDVGPVLKDMLALEVRPSFGAAAFITGILPIATSLNTSISRVSLFAESCTVHWSEDDVGIGYSWIRVLESSLDVSVLPLEGCLVTTTMLLSHFIIFISNDEEFLI